MNVSQVLLTAAVAASVCVPASASILATATYTDSLVSPGVYQYNLTLDNTGTTTVGTFWFAWIPGAGFMSATPSAITSPTGWSEIVTDAGGAIQWHTSTNLLAPGNTLSGFSFDSTETPAQLAGTVPSGPGAGDPITTSFVYIAAPLADPGKQFVPTPANTPVPEPSGLGPFLLGLGWLAARLRAKRQPAGLLR